MQIRLSNVIIGILMIASSTVFHVAKAGLIDPESVLLDEAGATLLEGWLGKGDLDWDSIWYGTTGATSEDWHSGVDGIEHTVSIYSITSFGVDYLVGGYSAKAWVSKGGFVYTEEGETDENFLFNLTSGLYFKTDTPQDQCEKTQTFDRFDHFATFGCGSDLKGGTYVLGNPGDAYEGFYSSGGGGSYLEDGNIVTGKGSPETAARVNSLETFSFRTAQFVPPTSASAPSTIALFALGFLGLIACRFKK